MSQAALVASQAASVQSSLNFTRANEREADTGRAHKGRLSPVDIVLFELALAIGAALGLAVIAQLTL